MQANTRHCVKIRTVSPHQISSLWLCNTYAQNLISNCATRFCEWASCVGVIHRKIERFWKTSNWIFGCPKKLQESSRSELHLTLYHLSVVPLIASTIIRKCESNAVGKQPANQPHILLRYSILACAFIVMECYKRSQRFPN
jgi:hypothetical protein